MTALILIAKSWVTGLKLSEIKWERISEIYDFPEN